MSKYRFWMWNQTSWRKSQFESDLRKVENSWGPEIYLQSAQNQPKPPQTPHNLFSTTPNRQKTPVTPLTPSNLLSNHPQPSSPTRPCLTITVEDRCGSQAQTEDGRNKAKLKMDGTKPTKLVDDPARANAMQSRDQTI